MNNILHTEKIEGKQGFNITVNFLVEYDDPKDHFPEPEDQKMVADLRSGNAAWFVAHVVASKHGIKLGDSYLGGCAYDSYSDFLKPDNDPLNDMIDEAITEALKNIKLLTE